jgi:HEPN domain-containing protein
MKPVTLEWVKIAEGDWATANRESLVEDNPNYRAVSFHSQQCGEKYLKAYLQEKSVDPERTHNLEVLLDKILPYDTGLSKLRESCVELTEFAVEHRYPGTTTSAEDAGNAIVHAGCIRQAIRECFGLET